MEDAIQEVFENEEEQDLSAEIQIEYDDEIDKQDQEEQKQPLEDEETDQSNLLKMDQSKQAMK